MLLSCTIVANRDVRGRTTLERQDRPILIAHRGASAYLPEHTLAAVAMAHAFGPDFIEPDLVVTKDNRLIVLHDIHLEANTNVEEVFPKRQRSDGRWYVVDFTLSEIKQLKVHERARGENRIFPERFPYMRSSFAIPTFEDYIELIQGLNKSRQKRVGIYPEIKKPAFHKKEGKDPLGLTMKVLSKYGYNRKEAKIFLQCFDPDLLKDFRKRFPHSPISLIQLIADDSWQESTHQYRDMRTKKGLQEIATYAQGIGPWIPFVKSGELIKLAHEQGLKVHVYTLREKSLYPKLVSLGVDGIFSDFPDVAQNGVQQ